MIASKWTYSRVSLLLEMVGSSTGDSGDDMGLIIASTAGGGTFGHFLVLLRSEIEYFKRLMNLLELELS